MRPVINIQVTSNGTGSRQRTQSSILQIDRCTSVDRIPAPGSFATDHDRA
jgi:hypothetical protein